MMEVVKGERVCTNLDEIFCMINQGRIVENEQNLRECINKCIKLQEGLLNSIKLIERTYLELHNKSDQTHLALNAESNI